MDVKEMLKAMVEVLYQKGFDILFVNSEKDGIEIGELKNKRITVNLNSRDELSIMFTIAHLFGHFIQFLDYDKYKSIVEVTEQPLPLKLDNEFKQSFWNYEKEAYGIGKSLMLAAFPVSNELDEKFQTFMVTDFVHYWNYLTTGKKGGVDEFNKQLSENYKRNIHYETPIEPIPIDELADSNGRKIKVTVY